MDDCDLITLAIACIEARMVVRLKASARRTVQIVVRMNAAERRELATLAKAKGEQEAVLIRRLVREAAKKQ